MSFVNVSDGEWHVVQVERVGQWSSLRLDLGDGPYINETFSSMGGGHFEIHVAQHGLIAGGDVRFPSSSAPPLVSHDFSNGRPAEIKFFRSVNATCAQSAVGVMESL